MNPKAHEPVERRSDAADDSRRRFLEGAGRYALATAPAVTLLLTSGGSGPAWASGGRRQGNNGYGNGGGDGSPGRSGKSDTHR